MSLPVVASAAVCLIAAWAIYSYNFFVHARAKLRRAKSGVKAQLKLRHELVPQISEVVRRHAEHEYESMRTTAAQRSRAIVASRTDDIESEENALAGEIAKLLAVAAENPRLAADPKFVELSDRLAVVEAELQRAATIYNERVEFYNSRAGRAPMSLVAMWLTPRTFGSLQLDAVEFDLALTSVGEFAA